MATQTLNDFNSLDFEALSIVEGGHQCVNLIFGGALTGAGAGFGSGMATFGVSSIPGAFVGAHVGAIAGGIACIGSSF